MTKMMWNISPNMKTLLVGTILMISISLPSVQAATLRDTIDSDIETDGDIGQFTKRHLNPRMVKNEENLKQERNVDKREIYFHDYAAVPEHYVFSANSESRRAGRKTLARPGDYYEGWDDSSNNDEDYYKGYAYNPDELEYRQDGSDDSLGTIYIKHEGTDNDNNEENTPEGFDDNHDDSEETDSENTPQGSDNKHEDSENTTESFHIKNEDTDKSNNSENTHKDSDDDEECQLKGYGHKHNNTEIILDGVFTIHEDTSKDDDDNKTDKNGIKLKVHTVNIRYHKHGTNINATHMNVGTMNTQGHTANFHVYLTKLKGSGDGKDGSQSEDTQLDINRVDLEESKQNSSGLNRAGLERKQKDSEIKQAGLESKQGDSETNQTGLESKQGDLDKGSQNKTDDFSKDLDAHTINLNVHHAGTTIHATNLNIKTMNLKEHKTNVHFHGTNTTYINKPDEPDTEQAESESVNDVINIIPGFDGKLESSETKGVGSNNETENFANNLKVDTLNLNVHNGATTINAENWNVTTMNLGKKTTNVHVHDRKLTSIGDEE